MFTINFTQYGKKKTCITDKAGLDNFTELHENGDIFITSITLNGMCGLELTYDQFWDYYEDFVG